MSKYKPYPKYKPSGVEWLGDVPEHWNVSPVKFVAEIENSGAYGEEEGQSEIDLPVCTTAHISSDNYFLFDQMPLRSFTQMEVARYASKLGDIFIVKSSGSNTNIISGKLGLIEADAPVIVFTNFLMRIRPTKIKPRFLAYFLMSNLTRERIKRMVATTTYPNINVEEYVGSKIGFPDSSEQSAIAAFLDRETSRIDALVEKKRRFIALLKEKRATLITAAVTGKFDVRTGKPHPKYKPSGVEWLGDVPEHWEVKPLKRLVTIRNGADFKAVADDDGKYPVYGSGGIFGRAFKYLYEGESVLLGRKGTIDKPIYVSGRFWVVDTMFYTEIHSRTVARFAYYSATTIPFDRYSTNTALPSMTQEDLSAHLIVAPDFDEQSAIAAFLDRETGRIDALVEKTEKSIELLKEKRAALITAAVTGKIDVRSECGQ